MSLLRLIVHLSHVRTYHEPSLPGQAVFACGSFVNIAQYSESACSNNMFFVYLLPPGHDPRSISRAFVQLCLSVFYKTVPLSFSKTCPPFPQTGVNLAH